jgi:hypothetical protein
MLFLSFVSKAKVIASFGNVVNWLEPGLIEPEAPAIRAPEEDMASGNFTTKPMMLVMSVITSRVSTS